MRFKKSKEEVLGQIYNEAYSVASNHMYSASVQIDTSAIKHAVQQTVAQAIMAGFRVLLENEYTDDDFERDMQLK